MDTKKILVFVGAVLALLVGYAVITYAIPGCIHFC